LCFYRNKTLRGIASEKESFAITTATRYNGFLTNEYQSNQKFLDKTFAVSGIFEVLIFLIP